MINVEDIRKPFRFDCKFALGTCNIKVELSDGNKLIVVNQETEINALIELGDRAREYRDKNIKSGTPVC